MNLKYYEAYRVLDLTSFLINCQHLNWACMLINLLKVKLEILLEMKETKFNFF